MAPFRPAPLSQWHPGDLQPLVKAAKLGRLVLYLGAGVSIAEPSCGPTGTTVADNVRRFVARWLEVDPDDLEGLSLEALAQRIEDEAESHLDELRERTAAAFDFRGMTPNFGHSAAALLLREGLVQLVSANWDCAVESAGRDVDVTIERVASQHESAQVTGGVQVYKMHGCATRPATIHVTQAEVDSPQTWAASRTQQALTSGIVVFVGLGTVGAYVSEPFPQLTRAWASQAASIRVVDPEMSPVWQNHLGHKIAQEAHIASTADDFFDGLLRAIVNDALDGAEQQAQTLAAHEPWAKTMVYGFEALRKALGTATADGVLRWWRDGVVSSQAGTPFITELAGQNCVMTVALIAGKDGGDIEASGARSRQTVSSRDRYFEIVSLPGEHFAHVRGVAQARMQRRHAEAVYADATKPITVVVAGARGKFPASSAPTDIAADPKAVADIASDLGSTSVRLVSAEAAVQGELP